MMKKCKWQLVISSVVILLPILIGLLMWNRLPEVMATHWNAEGEPNGWSSRAFAIFGIPLILFALQWVCVFVTSRDPKNVEQSKKVLGMVLWILPIISLLVSGSTYAIALGNDMSIDIVVRVIIGIVFLGFGNYMPKCRQNQTIGIKVTWALRNEENWNRTHRFAGRLWVAGGLLLLVTLFIPMEKYVYILLPVIFIMAFVPMIYSYLYFRKQIKAGTAKREDAVQTPAEKKMNKISIVIVIGILVFVALILFAGKFEIRFEETAFTVDAVYWEDATVNYADIDKLEYREQDDASASSDRTFGYGSFHLLMGEFRNSEFGTYTRYSYIGCDSCIVLTVGEKVLVLNGRDEERTKEIYDELVQRTGK